ncbi:Spy/CpxP family protein refolding chaperone [bacterium]|nr:Spy/CpxP family protein refolding chaperone [bacterium]
MKMTNRKPGWLAAAAVMILLIAATAAMAQGPGKGARGAQGARCGQEGFGPGHGGGFGGAFMAERLDLTGEQQTAIDKIREEGRKENLELRKQMMRLRNELHGEMLKDDPSEKTVLDLTNRMGEIRTTLQGNRIKHQLAVRKVLTPEQRDLMLLMGEGGPRGRGGRGGSGPGHDRCDGQGPGARCDGDGPGRRSGGRGLGLQQGQDVD